ncbi:DUF3426 domain-containing protein [Pseudoduganella sp. R-43]|uniref:DUF3426 domain-containing protein n=1 Tax=Pseudoduganella sp. R-43 TaxID=3404063 RepID=UPI003CF90F65
MALATKCPHCNTIFRVAADQLKLRGGIVRCGSCALVFDGNAALVEPAAKPTPVIPDVVAEAPPPKPAVSDYVHGSPVDFEIDFGEEPAPATPQPPVAEPVSPAVWRTAGTPAPVAEPVPAAAQPKAPSPDDIAIAAVTRAFAHVTTNPAVASPAPTSPSQAEPPQPAAPAQAAASTPVAEPSRPAAAPLAAKPSQPVEALHATAPSPAARAPSSQAARSLIDVVSPDAAFTAAAEPSPPLVADTAAAASSAKARTPAGSSSLADLVAPDAIFTATAEPSQPLAPPPAAKASAPVGSAMLSDVLSPDATFSAATQATPAATAPATPAPRTAFTPAPTPIPAAAARPPVDVTTSTAMPQPAESLPFGAPPPVDRAQPAALEAAPQRDEPPAEPAQPADASALAPEEALEVEAPAPVEQAGAPADDTTPQQRDETPAEPAQAADASALPPQEALEVEAPAPVEQADSPADDEAPPQRDEAPVEPAQIADQIVLAPDEASAFEAPSPIEHTDSLADNEARLEPAQAVEDGDGVQPWDDTPAGEEHATTESGEQAGASLVEAIDQWSTDNLHPDGRVEPSLDTPQEHVVVAALDDAHHFEDLPSEEPSEPVAPAAEAEANRLSEPSLDAEPWHTGEAEASDDAAPASEAWSLSDPDETAQHAVAAVNTDAPDDGASIPDEAPAEQPAKSRRERALKRAKSRRDASGPSAEHEVFALEENGPAQESSAEEVAARMRALAGVDEEKAEAEAEDLDHSDLSFVKRVDRSQKYGKAVTITMAVGVPILLAGLVLQAATTFRDSLAANYPQLKPALAAVCQPLGCKIALPTQLDALSVEPGELASMTENTFSFSTVLRNQSKTPQAWPHIELTLNDNADKPVLRRVFAPREYLPSPIEPEKGFGPRSEQSIKLYFELNELKASGYHIAIFYP